MLHPYAESRLTKLSGWRHADLSLVVRLPINWERGLCRSERKANYLYTISQQHTLEYEAVMELHEDAILQENGFGRG